MDNELAEKLGRMEAQLDEIHRAVLGNGQKGLKQDVRELQEFHASVRGAYWLAGIVFASSQVALALFIHLKS